MNIYRFTFWARCPVNGSAIKYQAEVRTQGVVMAEDLLSFGDECKAGLHEEFADRMLARFGGFQRLTANHDGVEIETIRWAQAQQKEVER